MKAGFINYCEYCVSKKECITNPKRKQNCSSLDYQYFQEDKVIKGLITDINKNEILKNEGLKKTPRLNELGCDKLFYNILVELEIDYIYRG